MTPLHDQLSAECDKAFHAWQLHLRRTRASVQRRASRSSNAGGGE